MSYCSTLCGYSTAEVRRPATAESRVRLPVAAPGGCSSVGRARRSHRRGPGFESPQLHTSYVSYTVRVAVLLWRLPVAGEPSARLIDVSVAEVAEALEAALRDQLHVRIDKDVLAVYSVTADRRVLGVFLFRHDDSFVWRVARAKPMSGTEFETWLGRNSDG
jgi:hypothetical protein